MMNEKKRLDEGWRDRLRNEIKRSGRSQSDIALAVGLSRGYFSNILREDKDPTIGNLTKICSELGISLPKIMYGYDISPEIEEVLTLMQDNPEMVNGILAILRSQSKT